MTARDVKNYRFIDRAMRILLKEMDKLQSVDATVDKVTGSNPEYPYEQKGFRIEGIGVDGVWMAWDNKARLDRTVSEYSRLRSIKQNIEHAAEVIEDPFDRIVWTGTMEGKSQAQIAMQLGVDQSTVSRKLNELCEIFS